jgi:hypothetical protein
MVAALPQTQSDSVTDRTTLIESATALADVQQQLIETIETETAVKLFTARSLPQADEAQRSEREAAIQLALRAAADVPLEVMRLCGRGLRRRPQRSCGVSRSSTGGSIVLMGVSQGCLVTSAVTAWNNRRTRLLGGSQ